MNKKNRKNKIKEIENESLLLSFLLATIAILFTVLKSYTFKILNLDITFSVFVLPFILYTSNYITKKYGFKHSFRATIISTLIVIAYIVLMEDLIGKRLDFIEIGSHTVSYFTSIFVNSSVYYYIISNIEIKKESILTYFSYIFSMFINHIIYMLFLSNMTDRFWKIYFISVMIECIITLPLIWYDTKIKRGL